MTWMATPPAQAGTSRPRTMGAAFRAIQRVYASFYNDNAFPSASGMG
jgi:hypothetical protein